MLKSTLDNPKDNLVNIMDDICVWYVLNYIFRFNSYNKFMRHFLP